MGGRGSLRGDGAWPGSRGGVAGGLEQGSWGLEGGGGGLEPGGTGRMFACSLVCSFTHLLVPWKKRNGNSSLCSIGHCPLRIRCSKTATKITYVLCIEWMGENKLSTQYGADQYSCFYCCCWIQRDFSFPNIFLGHLGSLQLLLSFYEKMFHILVLLNAYLYSLLDAI